MGQSLETIEFCTVRDGVDEWHIECRFTNGEKYAAVIVDYDCEELASQIAEFINSKGKVFNGSRANQDQEV